MNLKEIMFQTRTTKSYALYEDFLSNVEKNAEGEDAQSKQHYLDSFECSKEVFYKSLKIKQMFLLNNSDEKLLTAVRRYLNNYHKEQYSCVRYGLKFPSAFFDRGCKEIGVDLWKIRFSTESDDEVYAIITSHPFLTCKLALSVIKLGKFVGTSDIEASLFDIKKESDDDYDLPKGQFSDEESDTGYHSASSYFLSS